jgi:hypothetical protein
MSLNQDSQSAGRGLNLGPPEAVVPQYDRDVFWQNIDRML